MRYFVTGAAGFIGSHFVRQLLAGEYGTEVTGVTVYDKLTYAGNLANLAAVADDPATTSCRVISAMATSLTRCSQAMM